MTETHVSSVLQTVERQIQFLTARQHRGGWVGLWFLPDGRAEAQVAGEPIRIIKLSHGTSPSIAQVILRAGQTFGRSEWIESAGRFVSVLRDAECPNGGWPLYVWIEDDGRLQPMPAYWQHDDGPPRGVMKNGCTTNSVLFLLYYGLTQNDREAQRLAEKGTAFLLQAQDANALGLWCNTYPILETDDPFGNCEAGLADDSATPSALWVLRALYGTTGNADYLARLTRAAQKVAQLFDFNDKTAGWARYYDRSGRACDARVIEKATNIETRSGIELVVALIEAHRLIGDPRLLEPCRRWSSFMIDAMTCDQTPGWHEHYDRTTGQPVHFDGRNEDGVGTEVSGKAALALLQFGLHAGDDRAVDAARRYADFLIDRFPSAGWWATGYHRHSGQPLSYDWRNHQWTAAHDAMIHATPLALLTELAKTTSQPRYLDAAARAAQRLAQLQLDCGGWAFTYQTDTNQPAGGVWQPGRKDLARDPDAKHPFMHVCQSIYASESGIGNQIIAWELMNLADLLQGRPDIHHWQTTYGMPVPFLLNRHRPTASPERDA